jgi:hypothetical protein
VTDRTAHRMTTNPSLWDVPHPLFDLISSTTASRFNRLEMLHLALLFLAFKQFITFIVVCVLIKSVSLSQNITLLVQLINLSRLFRAVTLQIPEAHIRAFSNLSLFQHLLPLAVT